MEGEFARFSMVLTRALDRPSGSSATLSEKASASDSAIRVAVLVSGVASRSRVLPMMKIVGSLAGSAKPSV